MQEAASGANHGLDALGELYERHVGPMVALASVLTGDHEAAEDIAHDCFVRVASRWGSLRKDAPFESYLLRAVVNACRSRGRRVAVARAWLARQPRSEPAIQPADPEDRDALWRAISGLPYRQRAAVVLRFYEDLSEERTGQILGCSPRAVNSLVSRAMSTLRERIREGDDV